MVSFMKIYNQKPEEFTLHLDRLLLVIGLKTCKGEHFDNFHFAGGLLKLYMGYLISPLMSNKMEAASAT